MALPTPAAVLPTEKKAADEWIKSHFEGNGSRPGNDKTHWNRWCSACLKARVEEDADMEAARLAAGEINIARSEQQIKEASAFDIDVRVVFPAMGNLRLFQS